MTDPVGTTLMGTCALIVLGLIGWAIYALIRAPESRGPFVAVMGGIAGVIFAGYWVGRLIWFLFPV